MRKMMFLFSLFFSVSTAEAAYLDLAWDPNQEPDLAGYRVCYGTSSGEYINCVDVGLATTHRLDNLLEDVTFYIVLTAYDTAGNEIDFSEEVSAVGVVDEKRKLMVIRQRTDGKYKLHIYDAPTDVGGNTGPPVASDLNIGRSITDVDAGDLSGGSEDELVVVRIRSDDVHKLDCYDLPSTVGGNTGPPIASDNSIGTQIQYAASANVDNDLEDELVVVRERLDGFYKLHIYKLPTTVGGNTGHLLPAI